MMQTSKFSDVLSNDECWVLMEAIEYQIEELDDIIASSREHSEKHVEKAMTLRNIQLRLARRL